MPSKIKKRRRRASTKTPPMSKKDQLFQLTSAKSRATEDDGLLFNQALPPAHIRHSLPQVYAFPCAIVCVVLPPAPIQWHLPQLNPDEKIPKKRTRGKDKKPRRKRRCGRCKEWKGPYPFECGGVSKGRQRCEYFDVKGARRCLRCMEGV